MVALFMKKLVAAVVASHVAIVTGLHFYKKQRILESSPYKVGLFVFVSVMLLLISSHLFH